MQKRFRATNISRAGTTGQVLLRVLPAAAPSENARAAAPTFEDYCLGVFGESGGGN